MKKKMAKTLAVLMCLMTAVAFMPCMAFAVEEPAAGEEAAEPAVEEEVEVETEDADLEVQAAKAGSINVTFAVSVSGSIKVANKTVEVTDANESGDFDIDDVLYCAHEQYYPGGANEGYARHDSGWITKLWGESGCGYYYNNKYVTTTTDLFNIIVKPNDYISAYVYSDTEYWSDKYSYFDKAFVENVCSEAGQNLTLTSVEFDSSWNPVATPCAGAKVGYYENGNFKQIGTTDAKGSVTVKVDRPCVITAIGAEGEILVPPICEVKSAHEAKLQHTKVAAGNLVNGYEYDTCTVCGATKMNYKKLTGWSTNYVKSFKVSKGKKAFTAKWKKQSKKNQKKFNGYQIRYSQNAGMSGAVYKNAKKSTKSLKVKKLKKKTKYYVQVRSYTSTSKGTFYSGWSKVKSVKTR